MEPNSPSASRGNTFAPPSSFQAPHGEASALEELNLPLDPKRYLGGLWKRMHWIILGLILGSLLGLFYGLSTTQTMYQATTQLIRREVPSSFRANELGTPFQPTAFSEETFATLATSSKVLERVADKFSPKLNLRALEVSTSTTRDHRADVLNLTVSIHTNGQEAVQTANTWAEEVVNLTKELQAKEAQEIHKLLQEKVDGLNQELSGLNDQIEGLRQQEVLITKINATKLELKELQSRYTDQNPIVREKLDAVAGMEKELSASNLPVPTERLNLKDTPPTAFASLGGAREPLVSTSTPHLQKIALLTQLEEKKQGIQMSYNLFLSRLLESKLFEEHAPGYYQVFSPASMDRVLVQGKIKRTSLYALTGGLIACGLALFLSLATEFADPLLRTSGEMKKVVAPVRVFSLAPHESATHRAELISSIWVHWIDASPKQVRIIWSPSPHEHEQLFWNLMVLHASKLVDSLLVIDCAPSKGVMLDRAFKNLSPSLHNKIKLEVRDCSNMHITEAERFKNEIVQRSSSCEEVWIRLAGPVKEPFTTLQGAGGHPLVLASLHQNTKEFWENEVGLLSETIGSLNSVVTLGEKPWYRF